MFDKIEIKGFKSIVNDTIELGRVNVFIGENGCGKSNILEAFAYLGVEQIPKEFRQSILSEKGVRLAKPSLTLSSFKKLKEFKEMEINIFCNKSIFLGIISTLNESGDFKETTNKRFLESANNKNDENIKNYQIYTLITPVLRGLTAISKTQPLGIYGENLDVTIANLDTFESQKLKSYNYMIDWLEKYIIDIEDVLKFKNFKLNYSTSKIYFQDRFMSEGNNTFSLENGNEGILHILFYLTLMISKKTPKFFAIDNIESCLNPHLARHITSEICKLAKENDKQLLITTHNPAILDGLNLNDDEIRLFEVSRNQKGHTVTKRIKVKPNYQDTEGKNLKLSELWTRGYLGAISENF
jgi:predicted ATPase